MSKTIAGVLAASLLLTAGIAAAQELPLTRPQWTRTFPSAQRSYEQALTTLHGSWLRLGDGSYLIGSTGIPADGNLLLRGLEADGRERSYRRLQTSGGDVMQLRLASVADGGAYLLAGRNSAWAPPTLERLDASATSQWTLTLPEGGADGSGHMRQLLVLADGSALVVQQRMFSRINSSGTLRWNFSNGDDHQYLLRSGGAVISADGNLWLAGGGGSRSDPDGARVAAVRRMDDEGRQLTLHTFLCASCSESAATAIDALPDGEVVVVGRSGDNEPGFIAFYRSNGAPRLRLDTAPGVGYDRLAHDASGNIYAYSERDERVVALNRDGSVRWQREGGDMSALTDGVLVSQRFPHRAGALTVDAIAADGQLRWSQQIEASDGIRAGGAVVAADGSIGVLAQINRSEDGCGIAPRVITLAADGTPLTSVRGCAANTMASIRHSATAPGVGAAVALQDRLLRLTPDAQPLWQFPACPLCVGSDRYPLRSHLSDDGSLWLVQTRTPTPNGVQAQRFVSRISADGSQLGDAEIPADTLPFYGSHLLADAGRAILLSAHPAGLRWTRVTAQMQVSSQVLALPGRFDTVIVTNARLWPDGSSSVAVSRAFTLACLGSPPSPLCVPPSYTVLRINVDGSERWRAELGQDWTFNGFNDDGSTLSLRNRFREPTAEPVRTRRIGSDGSLGPLSEFTAIPAHFGLNGTGPVRGRYLIGSSDALHLLDANGQVLTSRPNDDFACCTTLSQGDHGFLVSSQTYDAALVSDEDLAMRALFDFDGESYSVYDSTVPQWQLLADGSLYVMRTYSAQLQRPASLTRFAVPGTAAADRIFLDRFD